MKNKRKEKNIIALINEARASGFPLNEQAEYINSYGMKTASGLIWNSSRVAAFVHTRRRFISPMKSGPSMFKKESKTTKKEATFYQHKKKSFFKKFINFFKFPTRPGQKPLVQRGKNEVGE